MGKILMVKDITGREIYLTRERWAHIQKHPSMSAQLDSIIETLQKPDETKTVSCDPKVHLFYKYHKQRKEFLFVSAKYLNGEGYIITSFFARRKP